MDMFSYFQEGAMHTGTITLATCWGSGDDDDDDDDDDWDLDTNSGHRQTIASGRILSILACYSRFFFTIK